MQSFFFFFSLLQMIVSVIYQGADWLCTHGWVLFIEEYFEIPMKKTNGKILLKTRSLKSRRLLLLSIGVQLYISRTETLVWTNPIRLVLLMLLYWTNRICVCLYLPKLPLMMRSPQVLHSPCLCRLDCRFVFGCWGKNKTMFFPVALTSKTECV